MSEPTRLRNVSSGSSDLVRDLLRETESRPPLTQAARARASARLHAMTVGSSAIAVSWTWGKIAAAAVSIGLAGTIAVVAIVQINKPNIAETNVPSIHRSVGNRPRPTRSTVVNPAIEIVPPAPEVVTPTTAVTPPTAIQPIVTITHAPHTRVIRDPIATAVPEPTVVAPSEPIADVLTREQAILDPAFAALGSDPNQALARVEAHESAFPRGRLTPEREFIRVEALSRLGRRDESRQRGEAFLRDFPTSIYAERVRHALEAH